jgi:hypothetical protein
MESEGSFASLQDLLFDTTLRVVISVHLPISYFFKHALFLFSDLRLHLANCLALSGFLSSPSSAVGIATGYRLDDRGVGVRVPVGSRKFSRPGRSDRLWGPPNLLPNG